ncbi:choline dehydrogenase [Sphingomonas ginsenosidivorax]|uniref:Choline dehydrogenase n=1 Tax=Sphingomonas ginsenosidivorax TaxID=862135 RepID=A0A5C6U513_9SPHN|nr:GMC family oxidoreductase N-terminal domain-containing protein [Sphingomonas ginsenosidivorax]TXC67974.1 choline dehydrogenase [Sphingomonas ginsenosidivorax]
MQTDVLVIGGGTAGAIMAARLSENSLCRVVLLEAGRDVGIPEPDDVRDPFPAATLNEEYFWSGLTARMRDDAVPAPYPQARVMGGGSSINGMFAMRGTPSDYARWAESGAEGLSWEEVVPYFRKIENDRERQDRPAGPHPISRIPKEQWPPFARAMEQAAERSGLPYLVDINEQPGDGFFAIPNAIDDAARVTSASCYLTAEVRARSNLQILGDTHVTRLCMSGTEVTGIEAVREGTIINVHARRIIVSAGAIYSPALLLRSGIGPGDELSAIGIEPVLERAGVGRNLQNHPYMFFALTLPRGKRIANHLRRWAFAGLKSSSNRPGTPPSDLFNFVIGRVSGQSYGPSFALVGSALYSPKSRGTVTLNPDDPQGNPNINFRFMSDPDDPPRMIQAARCAEQMLRDPGVSAEYNEAFLLPGALAVKQFNRPGLAGKFLALAAEAAASAPTPIRRAIFSRAFKSGAPAAFHGGGRTVSDQQILSSISPMGHPVGTCAMGRADDPMAVVDESFRVYGTTNLYVVDASVMPSIPGANTNLPTMMLAELAAERISASFEREDSSNDR